MKRFFATLLALVAFCATALAQPISPNTLVGSEVWQCAVGSVQGPSTFCTTQLLRSATAAVVNLTASITMTNFQNTLILAPQPAVANITLPAAPVDGQQARFCNGTTGAFAANAVTVLVNTGQSSVPTGPPVLTLTTLAANTCQIVQYAVSTNTWYRIQ